MKLIKEYDFTKLSSLPDDWRVRVGDKWANNEVQQYVNDDKHLFFDNGLVLRATYDGTVVQSARIDTRDKFYFKYGRIDTIAKIPKGKGTWPAIWMMPNDPQYGRWPNSGEIDIMEHTAQNLDRLFFCLHTEKYSHKNPKQQYYSAEDFPGITDGFHEYSLIWEEDKMTYLLDDTVVAVYKRGENGKDPSHKGWPFIHEFYLILNLAIGGMFGGKVDYTCFPQKFIIQSVKVYQ